MLTFDEAGHEYRWNGIVVPSVTQILEPLIDYSMVSKEVLERGQLLGTAVHRMTELHDLDDLDEEALDAEMVPYLDAWKKFRTDTGFVPMTVEKKLYHPALGYSGTSDRTGIVKGHCAVIDIKKMLTMGPVIGLQLAGYQALHNLDGANITARYALGLRADGTYRLQAYSDSTDFAVFLSLLTLRNWRKKHGA